jgi:dimeric dUTPase (all-alpha-NTP-PPase superfamily)
MNLEKLFQTQKVLKDRINYNEPDRFNKLVLALLVEIGECANEHRGFKFWSKDQEPRVDFVCGVCEGTEEISVETAVGNPEHGYDVFQMDATCPACMDIDGDKNPLLEEYVDGLHFVLELGLEDIGSCVYDWHYTPYKVMGGEHTKENIEIQFINIFFELKRFVLDRNLERVIEMYLGLGEMLGFTWEEVEQAYYKKNEINHIRQETGY